jgi:glycosyltransferase involved in cell wall biosynthesis
MQRRLHARRRRIQGTQPVQVTLFLRHAKTGFSIENITQSLQDNFPPGLSVKKFMSTFVNQGFFSNLISGFEASLQQGDVNHITGHIHYLAFFLDAKRTIITMHDCERLMSDDWGPIKKSIYKRFYFAWPARYCRHVTTISEESRNCLIKHAGVPAKKICVIPNGIDARFRPIELSPLDRQKILKNDSQTKTLLHISGLQTNKNIERLLEALVDTDIKLIRVGALKAAHIEFLRKHKIDYLHFENVSFDLLLRIYNAVDCLVFPSLIEGFGLPVIEAQACGCPVITSNTSSLPEVAGDGAFLVDPYSTTSIRAGIQKVLGDDKLRKRLIQKGYLNIQRFAWPTIAQLYYKLYTTIC